MEAEARHVGADATDHETAREEVIEAAKVAPTKGNRKDLKRREHHEAAGEHRETVEVASDEIAIARPQEPKE